MEEHFPGRVVAADRFADLVEHLASVHPSRYRKMLEGIDAVVWQDVHTIEQQAVALRFVVLADRLYDKNLPIIASGRPFDEVFTAEMMAGGYQKKYFRAVSASRRWPARAFSGTSPRSERPHPLRAPRRPEGRAHASSGRADDDRGPRLEFQPGPTVVVGTS